VRFKEAVALQKQGKLEDARQKYLQALALDRAPSILLNLALLEEDANRPVEALTYLRGYLVHPQAKPDKVAKLKADMLPGLIAQTARAEVHAQPGSPVSIDGKEIGNAPLKDPVDLMPGKHTFGAGAQSKEITFAAGETKVVDITPTPIAVQPAPTSVAPPPSSAPPAISPGVDIAPPPPQREEPPSRTKWIVGGSIAGVGVVGVIVGAGFAAASSSTKSDADALAAQLGPGSCATSTPQCTALRSKQDDLNGQRTASWVGYIGGGALIGVGIATVLLWPKSPAAAAFVPYVDRNGGGASFSGSF